MYIGHLWFVRRLFLFVLISPLIGMCVKRIGWWPIPIFLVMYILNFKSAATWSNLAFFYFGACCSIKSDVLLHFKANKLGLVGIACLYVVILCVRHDALGEDSMLVQRVGEILSIGGGLVFFNVLYDNFSSMFRCVDGISKYSFIVFHIRNRDSIISNALCYFTFRCFSIYE